MERAKAQLAETHPDAKRSPVSSPPKSIVGIASRLLMEDWPS
jgi:hypothetical protein